MKKTVVLFLLFCTVIGCTKQKDAQTTGSTLSSSDSVAAARVGAKTIADIPLPDGFKRSEVTDTTSFAYFLRHLPLKPEGSPVMTYDGQEAGTTGVAYAVIDAYAPGKEDLQQCADAIIHLRAEWLYKNKRYDEIAFHFTNGWLCEYKRWADGERMRVDKNKVSWYQAAAPDYGYETFQSYLTTVFRYAGTLSLEKELRPTTMQAIQIGDVFIKGGSPGHAIIVVDMGIDTLQHKGNKCFLVAESYMPAQDIHILMNINSYCERLNPWHNNMDVCRHGEYGYDFGTYFFRPNDLKMF